MKPTIHIPPSARLRFRLMGGIDAPLLYELDQDPEVMHFLNEGKPSSWEDIVDYFVPRFTKFTDPTTGCGLWEVADKTSGDYLGWILVRQYGYDTDYLEAGNFELGWRLKRHCWGQGIATEASQAIIDVLQQNPQIQKFCAIADSDNLGSIGVMKKLGMQYVDARVHHTPKQDYPVVYYEMPAEKIS